MSEYSEQLRIQREKERDEQYEKNKEEFLKKVRKHDEIIKNSFKTKNKKSKIKSKDWVEALIDYSKGKIEFDEI